MIYSFYFFSVRFISAPKICINGGGDNCDKNTIERVAYSIELLLFFLVSGHRFSPYCCFRLGTEMVA